MLLNLSNIMLTGANVFFYLSILPTRWLHSKNRFLSSHADNSTLTTLVIICIDDTHYFEIYTIRLEWTWRQSHCNIRSWTKTFRINVSEYVSAVTWPSVVKKLSELLTFPVLFPFAWYVFVTQMANFRMW